MSDGMKVETAPLDDISMGNLGGATEDLSHNKIKSNSNAAKLFDIDFRFLERDAKSFGRAFDRAFGSKKPAGFNMRAQRFSDVAGAEKKVINSASKFKKAKAEEKSFAKIGETLIHDLGEGDKMVGAGKLGAYALGAMALVDFLNPFDND